MFLQNLLSNFHKFIRLAVIVLVISITNTACSSTKVVLIKDIDQSTSRQIAILLGINNIDYDEQIDKIGKYTLLVAKNQRLAALQILENNGLPNASFTNLGEVFKKDSFISSPLEEHGRFLYAMDQEISQMLTQLNGVILVKTAVNIPAPNDNLWQPEAPKPSASVLIKVQQGTKIDLYINKVKSLVSNSVPGLTPDRVEVVTIVQKAI